MTAQPLISILIPTYKATDYLLCCVKSIVDDCNKSSFEICIYGDGGGDASSSAIELSRKICSDSGVSCNTFYNPTNLGNTPAVNACRKLATGKWLFFVNDDMVFPANWFAKLANDLKASLVLSVSCIEPNVGGHKPAKCFYGQNLGLDPTNFDFLLLSEWNERLFESNHEEGVNYPFCVEAKIFDKVGQVDERFVGPYHDPDLFLRFRLSGLKMIRTKKIWLYHFSGISQRFIDDQNLSQKKSKSESWQKNENAARLLFIKKWGAKPKAKFGDIPKTAVVQVYENRSHSFSEKTKLFLLLSWEYVRYYWLSVLMKF